MRHGRAVYIGLHEMCWWWWAGSRPVAMRWCSWGRPWTRCWIKWASTMRSLTSRAPHRLVACPVCWLVGQSLGVPGCLFLFIDVCLCFCLTAYQPVCLSACLLVCCFCLFADYDIISVPYVPVLSCCLCFCVLSGMSVCLPDCLSACLSLSLPPCLLFLSFADYVIISLTYMFVLSCCLCFCVLSGMSVCLPAMSVFYWLWHHQPSVHVCPV